MKTLKLLIQGLMHFEAMQPRELAIYKAKWFWKDVWGTWSQMNLSVLLSAAWVRE